MLRSLIALLIGAAALNQPLETILARLNDTPDPAHVHEITASIGTSPDLAKQLADLASAGTLKAIEIGAATSRFGASHQSGVINLTPQFLDAQVPASGDQNQATRNLVFVLGYEASKVATESAENAAEVRSQVHLKELLASTSKGSSPDLTDLVKERMNLKMANEARAYLQGWSDVLDAIAQSQRRKLTPVEVFQSLRDGRNTRPLLTAATLPEEQRIQPDSHFRFPANDHNLKAVTTALSSSSVPDFM